MTKDEALDKALDKALYALEIEDAACRYMKDETPSQIVEAITAIKQARSAPVQEPVAIPHEWRKVLRKLAFMARTSGGTVGHDSGLSAACEEAEALLSKPYTTPPAAQRQRVVFPTMLRKMWSGGEVQKWLDENVNKENA